MLQSRLLRSVLVVASIVLVIGLTWLRVDPAGPEQPLFAASPRPPSDIRSHALSELFKLGKAAEALTLQAEDGTPRAVLRATREDARRQADEILRLGIMDRSASEVASAIAALRHDNSNKVINPDSSWRPLLLVGKLLSLRAEALLVSEGPDAAWRQLLQGFEYAEALYRSAGSLSQIANARSIQGFIARTVCAGIATRAWPPAVLDAIAQSSVSLRLGPHLLRSIEHEYRVALAMAEAESGASPALARPVLYQPNRTEGMWRSTLGQAVRALSENKSASAYRLATSTTPVREQVPVFWRNSLGYKFSVPAIQSCIDSISLIVNAELQMQLLLLAANIGRHHAEIGVAPKSLEALVERFPKTNIQDPWTEGATLLRYDASAGVVYSVGANRTDEHVRIEQSFETSSTSDDYGVRLML
jgi:hypothetical protein